MKYKIYKADERKVTLWMGANVPPFIVTAIVFLMCIFRVIASTTFLNFILLFVLSTLTYIVSNEVYDKGIWKKMFNEKLPEKMTNDLEV